MSHVSAGVSGALYVRAMAGESIFDFAKRLVEIRRFAEGRVIGNHNDRLVLVEGLPDPMDLADKIAGQVFP